MSAGGGRLFVLGIDGLPPGPLLRFVDEGQLPNLARLIADGAWLDVTPTLPAATAPGWLTIASGAHPGTIGISNILLPTPGESPDTIRNGFDRRLTGVDYLWDAVADAGKRAVVVKYPGSWPPREHPNVVQVDGAGGYADITCRFEAVGSAAYVIGMPAPGEAASDCCAVPRGYDDHWRIDGSAASGRIEVTAREPLEWAGLAPGDVPVFETVLPVQPAGQRRRTTYLALALWRGEPTLLVARDRTGTDASLVAELRAGDWSDWLYDDGPDGRCAFRLKLVDLDLSGEPRLRLYRSEGHRLTGYTSPASAADELAARIGPVVEWTGTYDFMQQLVDLPTQLEIYDQHTAWLEAAVGQLAERPWDLFMVHWHVIEYAHHIAGAAIDAAHPRHGVARDTYLGFLRDTYRLLDRLVGAAAAVLGPGDTLALVSDHGHALVHTLFFVNDFLRERGWLVTQAHGDHDEIDWTKTRAYGLFPGMILLNTADWWHGGWVSADEAPALRAEIGDALRLLVDPRTGRPVVTAVLGPDELETMGQFGPTAPALAFTMDVGYEPATRLRPGALPVFEVTEPGVELTSGHGSFHPASSAARTLAVFRGPAFRPGSRAPYPVAMADLAPTFAAVLGVPRPQQCDGRALDVERLGLDRRGSQR